MFVNEVPRWDKEVDVVVLGFGAAGSAAAISAHDADPSAKVLILEKQPEAKTGGNVRAAGGDVFCPPDVETAHAFRKAIDAPNPPPDDVIQAWAEEVVALRPWLEQNAGEVGLQFRGFGGARVPGPGERIVTPIPEWMREPHQMPGTEMERFKAEIAPRPSSVWKTFYLQVQKRPIEVLYDAPAQELIQTATSGREVVGVAARVNGEPFYVKARRGVVLSTGGFEANPTMQREYWGLHEVYTIGNPANTGDGITMLLKAGADLWHMRNPTHLAGLAPGIKPPEMEAAFARNPHFAVNATSWIDIAGDGERFWDEGRVYTPNQYKVKVNGAWMDLPLAWVLPVHMIFDEKARQADALGANFMGWNFAVEGYRWSEDNCPEIERGWIQKADSIAQLAAAIGREPGQLEATVAKFNDAARSGNDPDFGRKAAAMSPIDTPPYYGVRIVPYIAVTTGGGRRNGKAQVLNPDGAAIPRLYEAGELGSTYANLFLYGCTLADALAFGRIAGRNVVKEAPQA
jgi:succinate dehydrogenase/fumarate reductase flavoprotein subunit